MKNYYTKMMLALGFMLTTQVNYSQVGIGTTTPDPDALLEINSTILNPGGVLLPRMDLTLTTLAAPLASHVRGMVVYNTALVGDLSRGLYYNDGTRWIQMGTQDWSLNGNAGTTYGTNFIGTTDATDVAIARNSVTKIRVENTRTTFSNEIRTRDGGTDGGDVLVNIYDAGDDGVIDVNENNLMSHRIHANGETVFNSQGIAGNDLRIESDTNANMFFVNAGTDQIYMRAASPYGGGDMFTSYSAANGFPINGYTSGSGWGMYAENFSTTAGIGAVGVSQNSNSGTGIAGVANGTTTVTTPANFSCGVVGNGSEIGVYGAASNTTNERYGGYFVGGDITDTTTPVAYLAGDDGTDKFGGYFDGNSDNNAGGGGGNAGEDYAFVGIRTGGTTYKIVGTGSNSTMINHNGKKRVLFSPEAPEILFQDFGVGKLTNGQAYIQIDPILANNIHIDKKHPLKVFIQLEGDCNGVYVTEKTKRGFKVQELKGGNATIDFSWQIVATRADTMVNGEVFSKHVDVRFPIGPEKIDAKKVKKSHKNKKSHTSL